MPSKLTQGTHVYFLDETGGAPAIVQVMKATAFNPGGDPAGELDDTSLESDEMEYIAGMRNPGNATLGIRPDPEQASHMAMWDLSRMDPSPSVKWAVGWSDGTVKPRFGQQVGSVSVGAGGTGYTAGTTTVTFAAPADADGITATGTPTIVGGVVTDIVITNPGSGYATAPDVTIADSGTGVGATATATLGDYGLVLPDTRTWFTMGGYISDFPFDFQTNALVEAQISIRRTGGATWQKKVTP
ncbi:phage tail protein [Marinobacter salinus]|uniref:Phage tail protein n=1 Tax=Marinobacter salinus TaxID=1874317 RepID=A0A1D9GLY4_9GAMM|nr:phage tail tube protein [Marinobacter salinus]AOY88653.1 phage tail protein [Marinobacter salinus]